MGRFGWESFVVSHHPAKFGGHRYCGVYTLILPQMQDVASMTVYARLLPSLLFFLKHMTCHALTHEISDERNICYANIFHCILVILPEVSTLPSLVVISLAKVGYTFINLLSDQREVM